MKDGRSTRRPAPERRTVWSRLEASWPRIGVSGIFLANGTMIGSLSVHFAALKDRLLLDSSTFSLVVMAMAVGAIVLMSVASLPLRRFGSAPVVIACSLLAPVAFVAPVVATGVLTAALSLVALGAINGLLDTAMNAHASTVERRSGRLVMSRIHDLWSVGGILGALTTGIALDHMSAAAHAAVQAVALAAVVTVFATMLLPASTDRQGCRQGLSLPSAPLVPIALMAFLIVFCAGAMRDWSSVYIAEEFRADFKTAAWGFAAFSGATALGRIFGDGLRGRLGDRGVLVLGGSLGALALAVGLTLTTVSSVTVALALLGLAHATLVPPLFSAAGRMNGPSPAANISAVMTIGFGGNIVGPLLIGLVADRSNLSVGLMCVAIASALVACVALLQRRSGFKSVDRSQSVSKFGGQS